MSIIADRHVLVEFGFSLPKLTAVDKAATEKAIAQAGAKKGAGKFIKRLYSEEDIRMVTKFRDEVRAFHYRMTLPWLHNGPRILPCAHHGQVVFNRYTEQMRDYRSQWDRIVEAFCHNYQQRLDNSRATLNGFFDERDYPSVSEVRECFDMHVNILPVPTVNDFRLEIAEEQLSEMQGQLQAAEQAAIDHAMEEVRERIVKYVSRLANVANQSKVFDSVVTNINDLVAMLPSLNLANDPRIEEVRKELASFTTDIGLHPDDLKGKSPVAQDTSAKAQKVVDKMSAYFG